MKLVERLVAAAFLVRFAPSSVDEDSSHGLGRGAEEMRPASPLLTLGAGLLPPRFVNESSPPARLGRGFLRHFRRRHATMGRAEGRLRLNVLAELV